jgi:hypothetical protein
LQIGSQVNVNLKNPGRIITQDDWLKIGTNEETTYQIERNDLLTIKNLTYQYIASQSSSVKVGQLVNSRGEWIADQNQWVLVPVVSSNQTLTISALLPQDGSSDSQVILAKARPHEIDATGATGSNYEGYVVKAIAFRGDDTSAVNLASNEFCIKDENGISVNFQNGQKVSYYILADANGDGAAIGNLEANQDYYAIVKHKGYFSLARTLDDVLTKNAIDLTTYGKGMGHLFRYEQGAQESMLLNKQDSTVSSVNSIAQSDRLTLNGNYNQGDTINMSFLADNSSEWQYLSYTATSDAKNISEVRNSLIAAINSQDSIGTGNKKFVHAETDPTNGSALILTASTPGIGYQFTTQAINRSRCETDVIEINSSIQQGDVIKIESTNSNMAASPIEYTVTDSSTISNS